VALASRPWAAEVLHFWFHRLRPIHWFGRSDLVDTALRRRFGKRLACFGRQPAGRFLSDPLTARAAVLLFDQCPRNLHRGSPLAFTSDPLARMICRQALKRGWDRGLSRSTRQFLYMPLMHSESRADQRLSLRLFTRLGDAQITRFARDHARMIARFGRFPHRNQTVGRKSTPAELAAIAAGNHW
jgi:uncharacterized protein (DUF924 family)